MVLGVSTDDVASHRKWKKKLELPYLLLADTDHAVCNAYGVWQEKSFMGKKYMGIARTTYVIDAKGAVAKRFEGVKPDGHAAEVAEVLKSLK